MKQVRWGLIGCGDIARRRVASALRDLENCDLVAISRNDFSLAETFAREFGARRWYKDWQDLIDDPELDAVYIATPVYLHAEQTIAAAQAGKHILCEKPMALDSAECQKMIDAAAANGVKLGVAYYRHFYPVVQRMKTLVAEGAIGTVVMAQLNAASHNNPAPGQPRHWLVEKDKSGGGPMMDFGCHRIEVLLNLFGPIVRVHSVVSQLLYKRQVEDTATALFEFAGGAHGFLSAVHSTFERMDSVAIYGSAGSLWVENLNAGRLRIITKSGEKIEDHPPHANLHWPLVADFAEAVRNNRAPAITGEDGKKVNEVLDFIYSR